MNPNYIIKAENISFSYNQNKLILDNINLSIKAKDFLVIMGASGSGKTTLLKLLNGSLKLQKGNIICEGKNISKMKRRERAQLLAMVPQEIDNNIPFTTEEIVSFSRLHKYSRWQKMPEKDKKIVYDAMKSADIEHKKNAIFSTLSGGEKQRVMIASALALQPQILLLDEPTSSLDIGHNIKIMNTLKKLNMQGMTIVLLTHNLSNINEFANNVIALKNGSIIASGRPQKVLTKGNLSKIFDCHFAYFSRYDIK